MKTESAPQSEPEQEKSMKELCDDFDKLEIWITTVLQRKFGGLEEAKNVAEGHDNKSYSDDLFEGGLRANEKKIVNQRLAENYLFKLGQLSKIKEEFIDNNVTEIEIGIDGHSKKLKDELEEIENDIRQTSQSFGITGFFDVRDKQEN